MFGDNSWREARAPQPLSAAAVADDDDTADRARNPPGSGFKTMHIGEVVRLWGNSGTIDFSNPTNQAWVFAQKNCEELTEVFTYTAWRPGAINAEKVPLFEIGITCAIPEPYVLFTTSPASYVLGTPSTGPSKDRTWPSDVAGSRVTNREQPDFVCIVPLCAMPGSLAQRGMDEAGDIVRDALHIGEVIRLTCSDQSFVFARKCGGSYTTKTQVFTYNTAWRYRAGLPRSACLDEAFLRGDMRAEEVPLFEIGIGGAVPEPYVLGATTDGLTRVTNRDLPDFFCMVPACAMAGLWRHPPTSL